MRPFSLSLEDRSRKKLVTQSKGEGFTLKELCIREGGHVSRIQAALRILRMVSDWQPARK